MNTKLIELFTTKRDSPLPSVAVGLAMVMVVFASVMRGGNRGVALLTLEWLALGVGVFLAWWWLTRGKTSDSVQHTNQIAIGALALSPVGVPAIQALLDQPLVPGAAWFSALAGVPPAISMLVAWVAHDVQASALRKLWLGVALAQAALGVAQLSGMEGLFFGMPPLEPVVGTYASKNTYANLLVMAIPLAVLEWIKVLQGHNHDARRAAWSWSWGAAVFTLLVTVMLTTSRAGIATGLIALLLSATLLPTHKPGTSKWRSWWPLAAALMLLGSALYMGGLDWVERFDVERLEADDALRALTREATWQGALAYWPLGSGLGSYAWVFPRFQAPEVGRYLLDLAHNDYLQLLMETGLFGATAMALALALMGRRTLQLFRAGRGNWSSADRTAVACGLGLLATLLHAWVDYPFRIPANAMLAAFLLGVFLRQPVTPAADPQKVKSRTYV